MFGELGGDPNALRPFEGVRFELERGPEDAENEGSLVLVGLGSATPGYLKLASETRKYRPLTDAGKTTTQRFATGDRFARVTIDGQLGEWLLYRCREDDLLVHTSGEMTNPLPIEQQFQAHAPALVTLACCVGDGLTQPLLLVELASNRIDAEDAKTHAQLLAALDGANAGQPAYSHVKPQHVLLLPPEALPKTVKGTAQRGKAAKQYSEEIHAALGRTSDVPTLAGDDDGGVADSLASAEGGGAAAAEHPKETWKNNLMWIGMVFILWNHMDLPVAAPLQLQSMLMSFGQYGVMPFFFMCAGLRP